MAARARGRKAHLGTTVHRGDSNTDGLGRTQSQRRQQKGEERVPYHRQRAILMGMIHILNSKPSLFLASQLVKQALPEAGSYPAGVGQSGTVPAPATRHVGRARDPMARYLHWICSADPHGGVT
ncbi:hypothetical protein XCR_3557 [Xanthomonas campestris pv. raphani 756C]|nr:hypothetical protein XCR_3557 [Xanthomonas campestris pv. raphani 756C]